jgi:hypothetical protein
VHDLQFFPGVGVETIRTARRFSVLTLPGAALGDEGNSPAIVQPCVEKPFTTFPGLPGLASGRTVRSAGSILKAFSPGGAT